MIGLISDTHGLFRPSVTRALAGVEKILHAGDVGRPDVLDQLEAIAPTFAVRGNVDHGPWAGKLPTTRVVDAYDSRVYVLHILEELDIDPAAAGMRVVLYGHTHRPAFEEKDGVLYVNPGSAGPRRFDLPVCCAILAPDWTVRLIEL